MLHMHDQVEVMAGGAHHGLVRALDDINSHHADACCDCVAHVDDHNFGVLDRGTKPPPLASCMHCEQASSGNQQSTSFETLKYNYRSM